MSGSPGGVPLMSGTSGVHQWWLSPSQIQLHLHHCLGLAIRQVLLRAEGTEPCPSRVHSPIPLLFPGTHLCNWSVPYQNHCILLQCHQLSVCQNAGEEDLKDLLAGNTIPQAPPESRLLLLLLPMPAFSPQLPSSHRVGGGWVGCAISV